MIAMVIGVLGSVAVVIGAVMSVSSPDMLFDLPAVILVIAMALFATLGVSGNCLLYTSPSPRDLSTSRMPSSA